MKTYVKRSDLDLFFENYPDYRNKSENDLYLLLTSSLMDCSDLEEPLKGIKDNILLFLERTKNYSNEVKKKFCGYYCQNKPNIDLIYSEMENKKEELALFVNIIANISENIGFIPSSADAIPYILMGILILKEVGTKPFDRFCDCGNTVDYSRTT